MHTANSRPNRLDIFFCYITYILPFSSLQGVTQASPHGRIQDGCKGVGGSK